MGIVGNGAHATSALPYGVILVVYVDDLKMAGPKAKVDQGWALLRSGKDAIDMDEPKEADQYLGCKHEKSSAMSKDGVLISKVEYNMEYFLIQCLDSYKSLVGTDAHLSDVPTPFIEEDDGEHISRDPSGSGPSVQCPWCRGCFFRSGIQVSEQQLQEQKDRQGTEVQREWGQLQRALWHLHQSTSCKWEQCSCSSRCRRGQA